MPFIHEDFLLQTENARRIYHECAKNQPILDYHNHLSPTDIASNRQFENLAEIWLGGDHYKWRAMRANGVCELFVTGAATPYEKFLAWAETVPKTLRNPLYHWTHLELHRYFGIDEPLNGQTAPAIWQQANARLATKGFSTHRILERFNVAALCTTDDPTDSLEHHRQIAKSNLATRVYPAFRPDKALAIQLPTQFNAWTDRLGCASDIDISTLTDFTRALRSRHDAFHEVGGRLSDHGLDRCYSQFPSDAEAAAIFDRARSGGAVSPDEKEKFASYMMLFFGRLDAEKGWTKQLHLGALRSVRTWGHREVGPDTGFDGIGDQHQAGALALYLDRLDQEGMLPKTVIYNCNPNDNYAFAALAACFQEGGVPGKIQFGAGWWFLDTKEGIEWQLNALSNNGLLARFIGMLTDSRSFMSFPRHEYFRRVLCNLIGSEIERGELPDDDALIRPLVEDVCFGNAQRYLGLETRELAATK